jgi:glycosyltransferase involved in cell wall biosynthesis
VEPPLIDIVVPNRNKAPFLPDTLASLARQTETRWRAIVIDGESTDGSLEILQAAARADGRIAVRSARPASASGLTLYRSWNHGLLNVRAPYFTILTSDDMWEPTWLARAIRGLERHDSAVAAVARAVAMDEHGVVEGPSIACRQFEESFPLEGSGFRLLSSKSCALRSLLFGPVFTTIHSVVFRRRVLEEGVIFAEDVGYAADVEYYIHTCLLGDIVYDLDSRAFFRMYPTQVSSEVKGTEISDLWRKIVLRNRSLVARKLGIPETEIVRATGEVLARHRFVMTKPNRETLRRSKAAAGWKMLRACFRSPFLAAHYVKCRADRERFLGGSSIALAKKIAACHALS